MGGVRYVGAGSSFGVLLLQSIICCVAMYFFIDMVLRYLACYLAVMFVFTLTLFVLLYWPLFCSLLPVISLTRVPVGVNTPVPAVTPLVLTELRRGANRVSD